jgi:1-deoxy-D-xylulose-5-phosphate synthase
LAILPDINSPSDLRGLSAEELDALAAEIRIALIDYVTKTGGHLGPNLGVVELTLALHRVFDSPKDPILWDTGHQSYVHKMVTGRANDFETLRQEGGLSGYPSRAESIHDVIENSHASTALSYADGIAKAFEIHGETDRHVVAVVGDGALTGGMTWEALNNIADGSDRSVIIVVNDNERSYSPTIGGMARHLAKLRTAKEYEKFLGWGKSVLKRTPVIGSPIYFALHGMKKGLKDFVAPQGLFEDLGLKYIGPVNGHNIADLEFAFQRARDFGKPVIVHVITEKGHGYKPAETDEADRFHAVGVVDPDTGKPLTQAAKSWTSVFSQELVAIGGERQDIVAITAAMLGPTGLDAFADIFPERTFDVGIAEQHAVTSAVGMAHAGLHPVIAIYATFLNRAIDQVIMDAALHGAGVTFALDRSGVTGDDGASHNGMWDMALLRVVPSLDLFAPRDGARLISALRYCVDKSDHPTVIRFSKGAIPNDIPAAQSLGFADVLLASTNPDVTIVSVGGMAMQALDAAQTLRDHGFAVEVIDPMQVLPVANGLIDYLAEREFVVTIEDGLVDGGIGEAIGSALRSAKATTRVTTLGIPKKFLDHATRKSILNRLHLDAQGIAATIEQDLKTTVR